MNPDTVKHELPDPIPPLEELRGKGTEGYKDKPETDLRDMTSKKDKYGNRIWREKKKNIFDMGAK